MNSEAQLFKALAEPVRLRILNLLFRGELCVCDIMAVLGMPQSTVSRHLAYLKNAGLIVGRRDAVWMNYQLATPGSELHVGLIKLLKSSLSLTQQSEEDLDALGRFIATKKKTS